MGIERSVTMVTRMRAKKKIKRKNEREAADEDSNKPNKQRRSCRAKLRLARHALPVDHFPGATVLLALSNGATLELEVHHLLRDALSFEVLVKLGGEENLRLGARGNEGEKGREVRRWERLLGCRPSDEGCVDGHDNRG